MELENFKIRLEEINEQIDDLDITELEDIVYKLEEDLNEKIASCFPDEAEPFEKLLKKIKKLKSENDFYDADSELNRMFPNRHDDDFDEDSMSFDSVFGED